MIYHRILDAWPRAMFTLLVASTCLGLGRCAAERAAEDHYGQRIIQVLVYADSLEAERDSLKRDADSLSVHADSIAKVASKQSVIVRERIRIVRDSFPALTASDAARDVLIDSLVVEADGWKEAYHAQKAATASLTKALSNAETVNDSLTAVLRDYKPPKKPSRISLGVGAGQCAGVWGTGPCVMFGVNVRIF